MFYRKNKYVSYFRHHAIIQCKGDTMDIKERFIKDFPVPQGDKEEPYIIVFDAYCGQGKSYTARTIARYDKSIILNNDHVRYWLNDYTTNSSKQLYELQYHRLGLLLKNHNSCIWDYCAGHNWEDKKRHLDEYDVRKYIIRLTCSEEVIKERMAKRTLDGVNFSIADYDEYLWCKENIPPIDDSLIDYVINTEENVEEQAKCFLKKYKLTK